MNDDDNQDAEPWWVRKERERKLQEINQWAIILLILAIAGLLMWWTVTKPKFSFLTDTSPDRVIAVPQE